MSFAQQHFGRHVGMDSGRLRDVAPGMQSHVLDSAHPESRWLEAFASLGLWVTDGLRGRHKLVVAEFESTAKFLIGDRSPEHSCKAFRGAKQVDVLVSTDA